MDWFDTTALPPMLQQAESALQGVRPTNPSSLVLALIGAGTYLLFRWGRWVRVSETSEEAQSSPPQKPERRRAA